MMVTNLIFSYVWS